MTPRTDTSRLYGTLNLLILRALADDAPLHGLQIRDRIHVVTRDVLQIEDGALYPALHRLERDGYLSAEWGVSDRRRRAKFYGITAKGKKRLERETRSWIEHMDAVGRLVRPAGSESA